MFITGGQGLVEATSNRDYVVSKMSKEIEEIIRVLQLTTYDEEEWDADELTVMKKALVSHCKGPFTLDDCESKCKIFVCCFALLDVNSSEE